MTSQDLTAPLLDPAFYAGDPYPHYARLRAEAPFVWCEQGRFWVASKHADVLQISADPRTFCSSKGILVEEIGVDYPSPPTMMHTDPPQHTRYRGLVAPQFRPSGVRRLEDAVREQTRGLLDKLDAGRVTDVVESFSVPLPILVIAALLGIPDSESERMFIWSEAMVPGAADWAPEERAARQAECYAYLLQATNERRSTRRDDLISQLVDNGLTDEELLMFLVQLLVAGNETTRNMLSGGLVAFAERPEQWQALRDDRTLVPPAVDEMLRWTTPVISFIRTATREVEIRGSVVGAGDPILLLYASADRDEEVFGPTAEEFDVARHPNPHVAFGFGPHFCLGAHLARLEGRVALEELLDRFTSVELAGEVVRSRSSVIAGLKSVPLVFAA